ncbi:MAG: TdeIII family type II restriction endonuclease [Clostridiales bacterium]|nr:TdeIII family type II restriction endonuclease [Clostridiales bacterium]
MKEKSQNDDEYRQKIAKEFKNCVDGTIQRITTEERTYRPFHAALLSDDILFWSAFERSFSTSFGQRVIEEIARLVALSNGASNAERQKETNIVIDVAYENAIREHMLRIRSKNKGNYDWNSSLSEIKNVSLSGNTEQIRIISDLWWKKDGVDNFCSLKTVKPNIDQTAIAKEDCFRLSLAMPECHTYFGLPYNPYGENKTDYNHNPPMKIFDFKHDSVVLIGEELWNTIGGDGCYEELLSIATEVGKETKKKLKNLLNSN